MATNTTNYNFVKQDENEFYDVNVVNQNLDEIDRNIALINDEVTKHLEQNNVLKHTANEISVVNPETDEAEPLQAFAAQLFTSVSNGKDLIGTAITDVDASVIVPSEPTFLQLADLIRNINTGPKYATGTIFVDGSVTIPIYLNGGTSSRQSVRISVDVLDFEPDIVVCIPSVETRFPIIYVKNTALMNNYYSAFAYYTSSLTPYSVNRGEVIVNNAGFTLVSGYSGNQNWEWHAFKVH